jgi:hypothetical protein
VTASVEGVVSTALTPSVSTPSAEAKAPARRRPPSQCFLPGIPEYARSRCPFGHRPFGPDPPSHKETREPEEPLVLPVWTPLKQDLSWFRLGLPGAAKYTNGRYEVLVLPHPPGWLHLVIRRQDRLPVRRWRDLQRIKNELAGPERDAIEVFPAESRLHDPCNLYDLWVLPEGYQFPVGWNYRDVRDLKQAAAYGAVQEPFEEDWPGTS